MAVTWKKLAYEDLVILKALLTEQGDIIYASGVATPAALPHGTLGQVLKSGGNAANPSWLTVDDTAGGTNASIAPVTSNVMYDHTANTTTAHGAVSAATASKMVVRDAAARAKVAAPSAEDDIALKSNVTTVNTALTDHAALTTAHGAVSAATASKIVVRDASARAAFAAPSAAGDAAILSTVTDHTDLTTAHGAVSAATADKMVVRDASARAKFAAPAAAGDALIKGTRVTTAELPVGTQDYVLTGQGASSPAYATVAPPALNTVRAVKKTVNYNDSSPVTVVTLPAGSLVIGVAVNVRTAFVGTTPTLDIGDAGDADGFLPTANITVGTIGWYPTPGYHAAGDYGAYLYHATARKLFYIYSASTAVKATIGGTGLSAGVADVYIIYVSLG